jgi:hypothetical protein
MLLPLTTAASHAAPLYFRFNFKAKNWVDDPDDFPLQFYFAFVKAQLNTGKQEETALCANLNKGAYSAHLPAGDGNNEVLLVKGAVMDKYEGTTKFSKMITVRKPLTPPGTYTATLPHCSHALSNGPLQSTCIWVRLLVCVGAIG